MNFYILNNQNIFIYYCYLISKNCLIFTTVHNGRKRLFGFFLFRFGPPFWIFFHFDVIFVISTVGNPNIPIFVQLLLNFSDLVRHIDPFFYFDVKFVTSTVKNPYIHIFVHIDRDFHFWPRFPRSDPLSSVRMQFL